MMTICTFNARTLATEVSIEDLMVQARKIRHNSIGLIGTRRHRPLNATFDQEKNCFSRDSRGVGGVGVPHGRGHEHLFFQTTDDPNRTSATEEMCISTGPDSLRRLRSIIQLL
ncbi:hypothetical protein Y032_0005g2256 [Ancylostoma ceylanicum]|uniref:Uncharacterized protein n=1 Tax=Ancylostoma ceylanicum TaxID=53326 RepID=A0A016VRU3_9BILA|nr:hypothetical protein Y032_0005g2256 [Ancylostoma ceylanicum]